METEFDSEYIDDCLKKKVLELFVKRSCKSECKSKTSINTNLTTIKPDSLEFIQFLIYVENKFEVFFEETEILEKKFSTIKKIRCNIMEKLEQKKHLLSQISLKLAATDKQ
jgi:acyl carrier protein